MERVLETTEAVGPPPAVPFPEMQWRLASYGASALAMTALLVTSADAAIISYTAPANLDATNGSPILFDFLTGSAVNSNAGPSADTFELSMKSHLSGYTNSGVKYTSRQIRARAIGNLGGFSNVVVAGSSSADRLVKNSVVNSSRTFTRRAALFTGTFNEVSGVVVSSAHSGNWNPTGDDAYLGFEFLNGAATDYGWAEVVVNPDSTLTLKSFGYDNSGAPIPAGDTGRGGAAAPDANPLLLLVVGGAAGVAAYRVRRRKDAVTVH